MDHEKCVSVKRVVTIKLFDILVNKGHSSNEWAYVTSPLYTEMVIWEWEGKAKKTEEKEDWFTSLSFSLNPIPIQFNIHKSMGHERSPFLSLLIISFILTIPIRFLHLLHVVFHF